MDFPEPITIGEGEPGETVKLGLGFRCGLLLLLLLPLLFLAQIPSQGSCGV